MKLQTRCFLLVFLLSLPSLLSADEPVPLGPSFQVNTWTSGAQRSPAVAADRDGGFVVAWAGAPSGVGARRFDAEARPISDQLDVAGSARDLEAALLDNGEFVVSWRQYNPNGDDIFFATGFDASGVPMSAPFELASNVFSHMETFDAKTATNQAGEFVVVTSSAYCYDIYPTCVPSVNRGQVRMKSFQLDGTPIANLELSGESEVVAPWVSVDRLGSLQEGTADSFMVSWFRLGSSPRQLLRYDAQGNFLGAIGNLSVGSRMAQANNGNLLTVTSGGPAGIKAHLFDSELNPLVEGITVSETSAERFNVALAGGDSFLIVWTVLSAETEGLDDYDVAGRHISATGDLLGEIFLVNQITAGAQRDANVAADPSGKSFIVVWASEMELSLGSGDDTDSFGIRGRRFSQQFMPLFADGFEAGDFAAWSGVDRDF